jgi:NAD(P)-dependent dehydrogenase (short-subunit alcohol dehydrogenase family)
MKLEGGQVAVVTGGASGLGLAMAQAFAARGLDLVLADVEAGALEKAVASIEETGASAIGVRTDVRYQEQLDALAAATLERFGRVDLVVNNAGVSSLPGPTWEISQNEWDWVLAVNLQGVINGIRAFVPHLVAQNSGHVVTTASMSGITVGPAMTPYVVSKHAVVALCEGLAAELATSAPGVGVTIVCPGVVATNIGTSGRNRPADLPVPEREMPAEELKAMMAYITEKSGSRMSAADAADIVVEGIEAGARYVAPNGSGRGARAWADRFLAALPAD